MSVPDLHLHTHPYIQNFIPNTVAPFRLLLNKEPGGTAAGRIFNDVSHLEQTRQ